MSGIGLIDFKTDRIRSEWDERKIDDRLRKIISVLAYYSYELLGKKLFITQLIRTQPEQDAIYLNHKNKTIAEKYQKKPWPSVHQHGRGADIRVYKHYTPKEIERLMAVLNSIPYNKKYKTATYHNVTKYKSGYHIHIQVPYV
jgi:hypothetical protein